MDNNSRRILIRIAIILMIASSLLICRIDALPVEEWNRTFVESDSDDYGYSVMPTSYGGYIIAGETSGTALLIMTDSKGKQLWNKKFFKGTAIFAEQASDGGYNIIGATNKGVTRIGECNEGYCWDMWITIVDLMLIETDDKSEELWNKTIKTINSSGNPGFCVQRTSDSGYILARSITSYGHNYFINNALLIKTDRKGNEQWSKSFGIAGNIIYSVKQNKENGYILAGQSSSYAWVAETDMNGNENWNKIFQGLNLSRAYSVEQDLDGGYIIGGWTQKNESGDYFGWLLKVDKNGNELWNKTFGALNVESFGSVKQTFDGGYILLGSTSNPHHTARLIKIDSKGNEQWNKTFGVNNINYYLNSIQQTPDSGYILTGQVISHNWGYNIWLAKISGEQNDTGKVSTSILTEMSPTPTSALIPIETHMVRPTEKVAGFEAVLVITTLLAVYLFGRMRM